MASESLLYMAAPTNVKQSSLLMKRTRWFGLGVLILMSTFLVNTHATAQSLTEFEKRVTTFTLDNGLTFIVIKRDVAPVVSFVTYADVGSVNEPVGNTGIAHLFEHMVFKGDTYVGTTDYEKEKVVLEQLDQAYINWYREKTKINADSSKLNTLWADFNRLQDEAKTFVKNNEFSEIIQQAGGVGLNAGTGAEQTFYYYSLPENKIELWFNLESSRFKNPVFREFYVEKEVVKEERRMRTENNPVGRLIEEFLRIAYGGHPYGNPVVGWFSDIDATTMADAMRFYQTFYVPSNITIAIAGDVDPKRVRDLADKYFGDIPAGPPPPLMVTEPAPQRGERRFVMEDNSQPFMLMGYPTVASHHPDFQALNLLGNIISSGRTSRLYKRLVEKDQLALEVLALNGFPGTKYQTMFLSLFVPNQGADLATIESVFEEELNAVKQGAITQEELDRSRSNIRAGLIRSLADNSSLALSLATAHAQKGDWRTVFTDVEALNAVTVADLTRVANTYLVPQKRTVGSIVNAADNQPKGE
jgi:predicted Zn-dependent peptidase